MGVTYTIKINPLWYDFVKVNIFYTIDKYG